MTAIIIVIAVAWLWSFFRFRRRYNRDLLLCEMLRYKYQESRSPKAQMELACGLMLCQRYADALALFEDIERQGLGWQFDFLGQNIAFCKHPLPWSSSGAKNHNGSWRHNFLLVRFGQSRQVAISMDTYLEANQMLRMLERQGK